MCVDDVKAEVARKKAEANKGSYSKYPKPYNPFGF
jgi:hypothetical protein